MVQVHEIPLTVITIIRERGREREEHISKSRKEWNKQYKKKKGYTEYACRVKPNPHDTMNVSYHVTR